MTRVEGLFFGSVGSFLGRWVIFAMRTVPHRCVTELQADVTDSGELDRDRVWWRSGGDQMDGGHQEEGAGVAEWCAAFRVDQPSVRLVDHLSLS